MLFTGNHWRHLVDKRNIIYSACSLQEIIGITWWTIETSYIQHALYRKSLASPGGQEKHSIFSMLLTGNHWRHLVDNRNIIYSACSLQEIIGVTWWTIETLYIQHAPYRKSLASPGGQEKHYIFSMLLTGNHWRHLVDKRNIIYSAYSLHEIIGSTWWTRETLYIQHAPYRKS